MSGSKEEPGCCPSALIPDSYFPNHTALQLKAKAAGWETKTCCDSMSKAYAEGTTCGADLLSCVSCACIPFRATESALKCCTNAACCGCSPDPVRQPVTRWLNCLVFTIPAAVTCGPVNALSAVCCNLRSGAPAQHGM